MSAKEDVGALLPALVDHVSHRGGETLSLMNEVGLTLPQVLFLTRSFIVELWMRGHCGVR